MRERDILNKNLVKSATATLQQEDLLKINENTKRNLEMNIHSYRTSERAAQPDEGRGGGKWRDGEDDHSKLLHECQSYPASYGGRGQRCGER